MENQGHLDAWPTDSFADSDRHDSVLVLVLGAAAAILGPYATVASATTPSLSVPPRDASFTPTQWN